MLDRSTWRRRIWITGLYIALTAIMTWPQPMVLATHATDHQDTFFNLWRLRWISHALANAPLELFNGNQFYPEPRVLAFSDAMLVEGLIGAPLLWARVPPVLVHNLLLLGAIVASAVGMFTLARHLSGSTNGAVAAGIIFAFAPYRFEHYMHMELQWIVWAPWAFWALQRTLETGAAKYGALTGVFLALLIGVVTLVQLFDVRGRALLVRLRSLAFGAAIAIIVSGAYSLPYSAAATRVGVRGMHEITMFSARPRDYRISTPSNLLYGSDDGAAERQLFPGILPLLLSLAGLLLVTPSPVAVAYLIGLIVAFELSLGMYGHVYPFLRDHIRVFAGLRAPARASIYCLLFLGVLTAYGCAAIENYFSSSRGVDDARASDKVKQRRAWIFGLVVSAVLLLEYWVAPLRLAPFNNRPPFLYAWLARQPRGVIAEFPMPLPDGLPGVEFRYVYMSTFHWMPLINGYSGYYPPVYLHRLPPLARLPDDNSIRWLRSSGVVYVIIHSGGYSPAERTRIIEGLVRNPTLTYLGDFEDGWGEGTVFRLR